MRYNSVIPFSALLFLSTILVLVKTSIIPSPEYLTVFLEGYFDKYSFILIFFIVLIESIVYVGFYFPGQLLAVLLVVFSDGSLKSFILLTLISILAVTVSAGINYLLGYYSVGRLAEDKTKFRDFSMKELLVAIIHVNFLALYMYKQGIEKRNPQIILYTGLLNLPYYFVLITGTYLFKEQVEALAGSYVFFFILLLIWLIISLVGDIKRNKPKISRLKLSTLSFYK